MVVGSSSGGLVTTAVARRDGDGGGRFGGGDGYGFLFIGLRDKKRRVLRSKRKLFKTPSLAESSSLEFDQISKSEEHIEEEEVTEIMAETMEQYMSKTRDEIRSGVARPTIDADIQFELKGQFLKELCDNTFSGSEYEDANEHIEKVIEIVDLIHVLKITQDQLMLRAFPVSLTGAASRWLRNEPTGSIITWEGLKTKFLNKYCPPARTAKKMEEINNFQQEPDESLFRAWERFKELLMKCPQHYLTDMQEVILFHNGLDVPTRQILNSRGVIPTKTAANAKVRCEQCKGPHYTKDCPQKEEGKILEEAYYTPFDAPFQPGGQYIAAGPGFYQQNNGNSSYPARRETMKESLSKFMTKSAKRHEENSNMSAQDQEIEMVGILIHVITKDIFYNQGVRSPQTFKVKLGLSRTIMTTK
ncbi:gypsy/ty3 retroelement polyprotein [Tanacetum coccineum]